MPTNNPDVPRFSVECASRDTCPVKNILQRQSSFGIEILRLSGPDLLARFSQAREDHAALLQKCPTYRDLALLADLEN